MIRTRFNLSQRVIFALTTRLAMILAGCAVALLLLELYGHLTDDPATAHRANWMGGHHSDFVRDAYLGWVPTAGIRSNGDAVLPDQPCIVAVGDSFTYGDQVRNEDTWPAQLERRLDTRVINGGVSGYGIDQAVMRAIRLTRAHRPRVVVLSFIPDDLRRCLVPVTQDTPKPYWTIHGRGAELHEITGRLEDTPRWNESFVVRRISMAWHKRQAENQDAVLLAGVLIRKLADVTRQRDGRLVVLLQMDKAMTHLAEVDALVTSLRRDGIDVVDTAATLSALPRADFDALFFDDRFPHMTPKGNALMARLVADHISPVQNPP